MGPQDDNSIALQVSKTVLNIVINTAISKVFDALIVAFPELVGPITIIKGVLLLVTKSETIKQAIDAISTGINVIDDLDKGIDTFLIPKDKQYRWVTKGDDRVRKSHAKNNNKVYTEGVGIDGILPGQEHGCRCIGVPVDLGGKADEARETIRQVRSAMESIRDGLKKLTPDSK